MFARPFELPAWTSDPSIQSRSRVLAYSRASYRSRRSRRSLSRWNPAAYPADRRDDSCHHRRPPPPPPPTEISPGDSAIGSSARTRTGRMLRSPRSPPSHLVARRPAGDLIHYSARSRAEVFILFDNYREAAPRASARLRGPPDRESTVVISDLIISRRRIIPVISARARARERKRVGGGRSRDTSSLDYKGHPWTRILVKRHFVASLNPDNSTLRFCCPADHAAIAFPRGLAAGAGAGARGGGGDLFAPGD